MRVLLFEDSNTDNLAPVALLRPVFELICGRESLRRRLQRWFPNTKFGGWVRPWLVDAYAEEQPSLVVNDLDWVREDDVLLVNGRWLPERRLTARDFETHHAGYVDGKPAWMLIPGQELAELLQGDPTTALAQYANSQRIMPTHGSWIQYPWDLVSQNAAQLIRDFADEGVSESPNFAHVQVLGDPSDVYISAQAEIDPYVVIDARSGPVSIDREAKIQSFTRIEGPCHVGRGSQIFRALIRKGTTIGEHCRVGGEVEESILHAYINKYHEGFLGHSYVCPWVNIGAMSCTSDLKNDYSPVKVPLQGQMVDSGVTKVGSFIGDHAKTAMDSMFNTGSSVGVMAMVIPGGRLLPRHIPSFSNVSFGTLACAWPLNDAIETAKSMMSRRGQTLTLKAERLLRIVHQRTEQERQTALRRASEKQVVR
ncbi:MAG TPA: putative sugar nucleotidyl transferase [Planctomycetaceae bacterium]|nr:putative sugar nucleotidyl transferase [Planctomycetaceae bacterium]HQZ68894.1 putative sugar nucleotidyl transferase [Planctomycetaceae bacterium]HRA88577.1 putative sugar nucleotidyl transferase [Planctomycetaceae bacterium]